MKKERIRNFRFWISDFRLMDLKLVTRNSKLTIVVLNIFLLLIISSCTNTEELRVRELAEERKTFLTKYESQFNPSDYAEEDFEETVAETKQKFREERQQDTVVTSSGFRVQIYISYNIDSAMHVKEEINLKLEYDWVYLEFDAPLYKVRIGDYLTRADATEMIKNLNEMGYTNAWIVPTTVNKFPPQKPFIPSDSLEYREE